MAYYLTSALLGFENTVGYSTVTYVGTRRDNNGHVTRDLMSVFFPYLLLFTVESSALEVHRRLESILHVALHYINISSVFDWRERYASWGTRR